MLLNKAGGGDSGESREASGSGEMSHLLKMQDADVDKADLDRRRRERDEEEAAGSQGEEE